MPSAALRPWADGEDDRTRCERCGVALEITIALLGMPVTTHAPTRRSELFPDCCESCGFNIESACIAAGVA